MVNDGFNCEGFSHLLNAIYQAKSVCNQELAKITERISLLSDEISRYQSASNCRDLSKPLLNMIDTILSTQISQLFYPSDTCALYINRILAIQSNWGASPHADLLVQILVAFSRVARLVEVFCEEGFILRRTFMDDVERDKTGTVLIETRDGIVCYISAGCDVAFGWKAEEVIGKQACFCRDGVFDKGEGGSFEVLYTGRRRDGSKVAMEAKGMTVEGDGVKCIWVTRPVLGGGVVSSSSEEEEVAVLADGGVVPISTDLILCHICERTIPALSFLVHNESCTRVHRAEMDIGIINDGLVNARGMVDERAVLLRREMEKFDGVEGQDGIVKGYLMKLWETAVEVLGVVDKVLGMDGREEECDKGLEWECPSQSFFYPPYEIEEKKVGIMSLEVPKHDGNSWPSCTLVDNALSEIGVGIYNLANTVGGLIASKREVWRHFVLLLASESISRY
jgi:hypothetical protein